MTTEAAREAPPEAPAGAALQQRLRAFLADRERAACFGLVAFAVLFNVVFLLPELTSRPPDLNDNVFHYLNLQTANEAIRDFDDPTDPWFSEIGLGYPVFHYYQHLPYVLPAFVQVVTNLPLEGLFHAINYVLLCLFPVSIYWSMRRIEFARPEAAFSALAASLISADGLFGFELNSYVWAGYGLYAQLWGMLVLPPALALSYRVAREGSGYFWAVVLLSATFLSHLAFGYVAVGTLALMAVLSPSRAEIRRRGLRLLGLLALVGAVTSYFLVPLILDSGYLNRSIWDPQYKYDSFGAEQILRWLIGGDLFDHGRLPIFTLFVAFGAATCIWRWREERYRLVAVFSLLWLLLYFGPATWGGLLTQAPLGEDFYFHRLIAGVHLGGIFLIGIALALPWRWATTAEDRRSLALLAGVVALAFVPVYLERGDYLLDNRRFMRETNAAYDAEHADLDNLVALLHSAPPGRVYAGLAAQWGGQYRVGTVPMHAVLTAHGIDNVGFLWHPWSMNGDVQVLFDENRPELYDLFNIRYVVAPETRQFPDFVKPVGRFGRHWLYEVQTTGYFDVVQSPVAFSADQKSFYFAASNWLPGGAPAQRIHPTLVFPGQDPPVGAAVASIQRSSEYPPRDSGVARPEVGRVRAANVGDGRYEAVVDAPEGGMVVLKVTYHPGWRAYLNGQEVTPSMVMPSYLGVPVPPGTHGLRFVYQTAASRRLFQLAGVLVLLGFLVDAEQRRRLLGVLTAFRERARL